MNNTKKRICALLLVLVLLLPMLPQADAALGCKHLSSSWRTVRYPTCTQTGLKQKVCSKCGAVVQTQTLNAYGHDYYVERQNPTCTVAGWERTKCARCNQVLNTVTRPALGHSLNSTWTRTKNPTCTAQGQEYQYCSRCNQKVTRSIPALGHQLSWVTTAVATCVNEGIQTQKCSRCGVTVATNPIPVKPNNHTPGEYVTLYGPTCTKAGKRVQYCMLCSTVLDELEIALLGHSYANDDWTTLYDATCTATGVAHHYCQRGCGAEETRTIPMKHHLYQPATCTKPETCFYCGDQIGGLAPHKFLTATCTNPSVCVYCKCPSEDAPKTHQFNEFGYCTLCRALTPAPGYNPTAPKVYLQEIAEILENTTDGQLKATVENGVVTFSSEYMSKSDLAMLNQAFASLLVTDQIIDYRPQLNINKEDTYVMITPREKSSNPGDEAEWMNSGQEVNISFCRCLSNANQNGIEMSFEMIDGFTIRLPEEGAFDHEVTIIPNVCEPMVPEVFAHASEGYPFRYMTTNYTGFQSDTDTIEMAHLIYDGISTLIDCATMDYWGAAGSFIDFVDDLGYGHEYVQFDEITHFHHKEQDDHSIDSWTAGGNVASAKIEGEKVLSYKGDKLVINLVCENTDYSGIDTFFYLQRHNETDNNN